MLYVIATPIGNLADFTHRAIEALQSCDLVLCEDTRHSRTLLNRYSINKPLLSFHGFNEKKREEAILNDLHLGKNLCLLSDAGTPLICDPGRELIEACIRHHLPFTTLPGPCSPIAALTLSGFETERFQFLGFLPKEKGPLRKALLQALFYQGTTIAFESPHRLLSLLKTLRTMAPDREMAIARELTKTHEECLRGTAHSLVKHFETKAPKGEIVWLLKKGAFPEEELDLMETISLLQELHGLSKKEALRTAAQLKGESKSSVYRLVHLQNRSN